MTGTSKRSDVAHAPADTRQRGLALLIVLWIIVAAALLVSAFNATVRSGVSFVGSEVQLTQTQALLDAGAEIAASRLIDEEEARRWAPDGSLHRVSFAGATLAIGISDTSGRIDINKADKKLLMGLLRQFAGSEAKAGRLRDLILLARGKDPGAKEKSESQGDANADADSAKSAKSDVPAFMDIAQLRDLPGMTPQLYRAIAPFITVYSSDGRINPRAAPDEVLASIPGLTRGDIEKVHALAKAPPDENDPTLLDIVQRVGAYLIDKPGPGYLITVQVLWPGAEHAASAVYVVVPGIDGDAPYRLIAKRPDASVQLSGAS
jgi:general secretion pathway protein K